MEALPLARITPRPQPTTTRRLRPRARHGARCGESMGAAYHNYRTVTTLAAGLRLTLHIRRCVNPTCPQVGQPSRPEEEGRLALPKHALGLEVIALIGALRSTQHRRRPEMHDELQHRRVILAPRTVLNLWERYAELVTLSLTDTARLKRLTTAPGRGLLALDGLHPEVGHAGLWVVRDCLSHAVLCVQRLLSATHEDLSAMRKPVRQTVEVPIVGVSSDGQLSIRRAVATALPTAPHQLCHCHSLREAAKPIYEADRHANQALKKCVRGVRPIARQLDRRTDPEAQVIRGDCSAVRSALTDDARPPWSAAGLTLHERLTVITPSLDRLGKQGLCLILQLYL